MGNEEANIGFKATLSKAHVVCTEKIKDILSELEKQEAAIERSKNCNDEVVDILEKFI